MEIFDVSFSFVSDIHLEKMLREIICNTENMSLTNYCVNEGEPSSQVTLSLQKCKLNLFIQDSNSACFDLYCSKFNLRGIELDSIRINIAKLNQKEYILSIWYDYIEMTLEQMHEFHKYALELGQKYQVKIDDIEAEDTCLPDLVFKGKYFYVDYI